MIPPKKPNQRHITVRGRISTSSADSAPFCRFIPLTQGKFAIVDAEDYPRLSKYKWRSEEDTSLPIGFEAKNENDTRKMAIAFLTNGCQTKGLLITRPKYGKALWIMTCNTSRLSSSLDN